MKTSLYSRNIWPVSGFLICLGLIVLLLSSSSHPRTAGASPVVQTTPCPATACVEARAYGYQPRRYDMRSTFNDAAGNALGNSGPSYSQINRGIPPTPESVSTSRPIPHILLRGMAWQESHWLQFADSVSGSDDTYACTLISGDCGYGMMQITSCMNDGCGWFAPGRVAGELSYNLGAGTNFIIRKWNESWMPFIGDNDHTVTEQWYYTILAYNGWSRCNDPNRATYLDWCPPDRRDPFNPIRPPYGEGDYNTYSYPYQERVWGWIAHPEEAHPVPIPSSWHWLWRPGRSAAVPRGIFGLGSEWQPPSQTPKPVYYLLSDISVNNGVGPSIVLRNTTGQALATDVTFYNANHTFNRRWLEPVPNPPPYIRLNANSSRVLAVAAAFPGESFSGYARVSASEGVEVTSQSPYPKRAFLPLAFTNYGGNCYNEIYNGGFEQFVDGKPQSWTVSSTDAYPLADGTWFANGHYGAYLGGYDSGTDILRQYISIPGDALSVNLGYAWSIQSEEPENYPAYDILTVGLRNMNNDLVATLSILSNQSPRNSWQTAAFSLLPYAGQGLRLSL